MTSLDERPVDGDAAALERALRAEGFDAGVEREGRLAVIVPRSPALATAALRARAWPLARAAGFTHAAVELVAEPAPEGRTRDAAVPRD